MLYATIDSKSIRQIIKDKTYINDESTLQNRVAIQKWANEGKGFGKFLNSMVRQSALTPQEALLFALRHGYASFDGKRLPATQFIEIPIALQKMGQCTDINNPEVAMIIYNIALKKLATAYTNYLVRIKTPTKEDIANILNLPKKEEDTLGK